MNNQKFQHVPSDTDTTIIRQEIVSVDGIEVLKQEWRWEAVKAKSLILSNTDADAMTDDELKQLVKDDKTQVIVKRCQEFTFVNYCFRVD